MKLFVVFLIQVQFYMLLSVYGGPVVEDESMDPLEVIQGYWKTSGLKIGGLEYVEYVHVLGTKMEMGTESFDVEISADGLLSFDGYHLNEISEDVVEWTKEGKEDLKWVSHMNEIPEVDHASIETSVEQNRAETDDTEVSVGGSSNQLTWNPGYNGGWGGSCTCPDGQIYQVGDKFNYCGSLNCHGGKSGTCNRSYGFWSHKKVICGNAVIATGGGGWGGSCTCPNGQIYQVGDKFNYCGSLNCHGGKSGSCHKRTGTWSYRKVICGGKSKGNQGQLEQSTELRGEAEVGISNQDSYHSELDPLSNEEDLEVSVGSRNCAKVYEHSGPPYYSLTGHNIMVKDKNYDSMFKLGRTGLYEHWEDRISSFRVLPGCELTTYCGRHYKHRMHAWSGGKYGHNQALVRSWNDCISSMKCKCDAIQQQRHTGNQVIENASGVGGWGGSCTCPNGQIYQVGDNYDACGSLACVGGDSGYCNKQNGGIWSGRRVICSLSLETAAAEEAEVGTDGLFSEENVAQNEDVEPLEGEKLTEGEMEDDSVEGEKDESQIVHIWGPAGEEGADWADKEEASVEESVATSYGRIIAGGFTTQLPLGIMCLAATFVGLLVAYRNKSIPDESMALLDQEEL